MLLEARQNRTKPSVVGSRAGILVSWPSKTRAAKTKPFLIHCFGRRETSRAPITAVMIAGRGGRGKRRDVAHYNAQGTNVRCWDTLSLPVGGVSWVCLGRA